MLDQMKIYLENRGTQDGAECNKWFSLEDDSTKVIARWGSIGAKGQSKVLVESPDASIRKLAWDKKFNEKTKRKANPYVIISQENDAGVHTQVESRPADVGRYWGLEVETHSNLNITEIVEKLKGRGLLVNDARERYFHSTGQVWDVKRDGSCGFEFASPKLRGDSGLFDAKIAVEKIREVCSNAVNRQCGIHVTVDIADHSPEDLKRLAIAYLKAQEHFYKLCAEWRQNNQYCKRNPVSRILEMIDTPVDGSVKRGYRSTIQQVISLCGGHADHSDRYHGLNWTRAFTIKAVEFRMLESSVDIRKVGSWIRTCVGFIDGIKKSGVTFKTNDEFTEETFKKIISGQWK